MAFNQADHSPTYEKLRIVDSESIRMLSWNETPVRTLIHQGESTEPYTAGMGGKWHYHPEMELTWFLEGEGLRFVGESIERFQAPDLVMIGSFLPHYWVSEKSRGISIQFRFSVDSPLVQLPEIREKTPFWEFCKSGLALQGDRALEIEEILRSMLNLDALGRLSHFIRIIGLLAHSEPQDYRVLSKPINFTSGTGAYAEKISDAIKYITTHFHELIELSDVLDHISLNRASFSRHFSNFTGQSFTSFLQKVRLEHCRRLIATSDYTITEAALESGFQNLSNFNRVFRQNWGCTPRQFRQSLRDESQIAGVQ